MDGATLSLLFLVASFDCQAEDLKPAKQMVCHNNSLSKMDEQVMGLYDNLARSWKPPSVNFGKEMLQREHKSWLIFRDNCGYDVICLERLYRGRLTTLRYMMKRLDDEPL